MANKELMNKELKEAQSMNEIFAVLNKYYDLDSKLGAMSKGAVLLGLQKAIQVTNTKEK
jgi:hypothetical protein